MKKNQIFFCFVLIVSITACKKAKKPTSNIESIRARNGSEVIFNIFYQYSNLHNLSYGICWSDTNTIPTRQDYYPLVQYSNYAEKIADTKSGTKALALQNVVVGIPLRARSYIKYEGGSTLYSKEVFEFKTDFYSQNSCGLVSNELRYGSGSTLPITFTSGNYVNNLFEVMAQSTKYTFFLAFGEIPSSSTEYLITQSPPNSFDDELQVRVFVAENNVNCNEFYVVETGYLSVNNVFNNTLYIDFCDVQFKRSDCTPDQLSFAGKFEVNI